MEHGETLIVGLGEVGAALAEVLERRSRSCVTISSRASSTRRSA